MALATAAALLPTTLPAQSTPPQLPYSRGFLVTGDYVAGGVDLREATNPIVDGLSTAPISMSGVPPDADIIAASLYWETVTTAGDVDPDAWKTESAGVKFRGFDLDVTNVLSVKRTQVPSLGAQCFGSGSLTMNMFRGDVLRFLPVKVDSAGKPTGKRLVNDTDLVAQGLDPHTVTLPVRDGNSVPESAGATLVVVYRDPNPNAPLKKVVIYDGNILKPNVSTALNLTIKGIYESATAKSAKITHIVSSGQPNSRLKFSFTGAGASRATTIANSPFTSGPSSQRWWANPTVDVSSMMNPGVNSDTEYGETVQTSIFHQPTSGSDDCLASAAVVFSTSVADLDKDGLPDALERSRTTPVKDADDSVLPNLFAMGAGDHGTGNQPDIFIEVNAMKAAAGTSYGSAAAPFSATETVKTDPLGHNHLPTPYALRLVGEAFASRGIRVHFDVGNITQYRTAATSCPVGPCTPGIVIRPDFVDDYTSTEADAYLIPSALARGGEAIREIACNPDKPNCHFPDYPGTVPWKIGMQAHRDAPVDDAGLEIVPVEQGADTVTFAYPAGGTATWNGRRRFDPERRGLFKYLLYAHARGNPKSMPCLIDDQPAPYLELGPQEYPIPDTPNCGDEDDNPAFVASQYHVPTSASGVAELPGGNFMVTLGFWDEFVGRPFVRASTTFHELGHTLGLYHGGPETERTDSNPNGAWAFGAARWGTPATATQIEANCKANYLSSMSYLFQVHGLFDNTDQIHLDYSWTKRDALNELNLFDNVLAPLPNAPAPSYQTAWFAPVGSDLAIDLGITAAKRYCNGALFATGVPAPQMARVFSESVTAPVNWNGDGLLNAATTSSAGYDGNFDNAIGTLGGYSDWDNIRLNQTGAVVTGVSSGSAEGVFFDNSGTANGVFFDNSGVFFDQSGVWFDNSGVWFDNAGGVFFDNSGVFFDNSGVFFDNSGVWFDNAGGVWFDNAGGVFFDNAGGVFFDNSGVFFDNAGGVFFDNSGQEISYDDARSFGRGRPHRVGTCVVDENAKGLNPDVDNRVCSTAQPNTPTYDRIEVHFEQLQVGGISAYEVQRMSTAAVAGTPDATFATAGTVAAHLVSFTDPAELADGVTYTYRVRGLSTDEFGNSGWSRLATEVAVNKAPEAVGDSYSVAAGAQLTVAAPGVLANDTQDVDSPATSRRLFNVTSGPSHGTLSWNADGSFTYTPAAGYAGPDSFAYVADNGAWSGDPAVPLSPPSNAATVSINVTGVVVGPSCATLLTATVAAGSTTLIANNCAAGSGGALTVTAVTAASAGTASVTNPLSGSFSYTAPATGATATFSYTVTNASGTATGNAQITVTAPAPTPYGFVNVQNLPAAGNKTNKTGSSVPLRWQWTTNGVAVNTSGQAAVRAYACDVTNPPLPPGYPVGAFDPSAPGSGNSFSFDTRSNTWSFNWKLQYTTTSGTLANLPVGRYIVQVINSVTGQMNPTAAQQGTTCGGFTGALVTVVKQ